MVKSYSHHYLLTAYSFNTLQQGMDSGFDAKEQIPALWLWITITMWVWSVSKELIRSTRAITCL